jgi:tetratricopeptide (TPR) repeat protein
VNNFRLNSATTCNLIAISVLGALIYSNTLTAAFQFDDKLNIVDNLLIRDIGNLWPPAGARWFGTLTFALNYMVNGLNPVGYHLVNICIHILTALSVYFFVLLTFKTPFFRGGTSRIVAAEGVALACALLFVAHPIQTQAVTYIVQRFASLAALLFMLSINFYLLARLSAINRNCSSSDSFLPRLKTGLLYAAACVFALFSFKTKENSYTLPLVVLVYDLMFISSFSQVSAAIRKRWRTVAPLSGLALAFLIFVTTRHGLPAFFDKLKATNEISRHDYLITQFRVIVTYLRLLFFPVGQTIDHRYPVFHSLFEPAVLASLLFLVLLAAAGLWLHKISRTGMPCLRLIALGIFWFFTTLSVESSLIPISDVMFEHRLYLPSIGVILAVIAALVTMLERTDHNSRRVRRAAASVIIVVTAALSFSAYARNRVWKNELTLWTDVISKTPRNPRGYNMLGSYYQANFRIYEAIGYFRKALEVDSSYAEARSNLGNAYILTGRIDEGLNELMITARNNRFDAIDTGILYYNIGKGFFLKGMPDQAIENLNRALSFIPDEAAVHAQLGVVYRQKGLPDQGAAYARKAHELNPGKY